jgi:hAT family C-terminal dimerisation region
MIAKMARDYLAIPATSVSVERVFSMSRHICSDLRSSLKEDTVKMALLTKEWIHSGLFEMMPRTVLRRKHGDNGKKK